MKKLLVFILFFLGFLTLCFSVAKAELVNKSDGNHVIIEIKKGWNLIPVYISSITSSSYWSLSGMPHDSIKALYILDAEIKSYISSIGSYNGKGFSNEQQAFFSRVQNDNDLMSNLYLSAIWAYSNQDGKIELESVSGVFKFFDNNPQYLPFNGVTFYKGWNFFSVVPDLSGKSLADIKGDCEINKAVFWDNSQQNWIPRRLDQVEFTDQDTGLVIALKVTNTCKLSGSGNAGIINPPAIPN